MSRYYCLARPPEYANYPNWPQKPMAIEVWMPGRKFPGGDDRYALGQLDYAELLPLETIWHWTLWPADRKEWAELVFWREGGGNPVEVDSIRNDYINAPVEDLLEMVKNRVVLAEAALVLLGRLP